MAIRDTNNFHKLINFINLPQFLPEVAPVLELNWQKYAKNLIINGKYK